MPLANLRVPLSSNLFSEECGRPVIVKKTDLCERTEDEGRKTKEMDVSVVESWEC